LSSSKRILIVEDEASMRRILEVSLGKAGYETSTAENGQVALQILSQHTFDCVLTDVTMPGLSGYKLQTEIADRWPQTPVIIMTAFGTIKEAVSAIRNGAFEFVTKPFDLDQLKRIVKAAVSSERKTPKRVVGARGKTDFIAESPQMKDVLQTIRQVADAKASVLITGESGTGKEVVAKLLHEFSGRAQKPFIACSCAAIPETLLESELFGHEKGAYTGADTAREGRFEAANSGTLFLDEIGEVPLSIQAKLLRVIQEREFERLGANESTKVDVRLVTATNRDLETEVSNGTFRLDLLYRLQVIEIPLAPLRERAEDILPLARYFLTHHCAENDRSALEIAPGAEHALMSYHWPGNVRELGNAIERAVVMSPQGARELEAASLPKSLRAA
jgi:two-component system response regulator AtoC